MNDRTPQPPSERLRLSPDLTTGDFQQLLDRATQVATDHWDQLFTMKAFPGSSEEVIEAITSQGLPQTSIANGKIFDRIISEVTPYSVGMGHPRWWGFVNPPPHPMGIAADLIATTLNNNCTGYYQAAKAVEETTLRWLAELAGMPEGSGGVFTSGGSMANYIGLAAARQAGAPESRVRGLHQYSRQMTVYASSEAHSCVVKAVEMLGLGSDHLRIIPVDEDLRMNIAALRERIASDRADGYQPLAIVASVGTVNTGRVDPLNEIADLATEEKCWLHLDGAYGGVVASLPELRELYKGIERADSIAVDPHKWLYVPYEAGAVIVKNPEILRETFATSAGYLAMGDDSHIGDVTHFASKSPQLSRGFKALKVWAVMQSMGLEQYHRLWRSNMEVAREVATLARAEKKLQVMAETDLSIFCLRYLPESGNLNAFNRELLERIHHDGRVFLSPVVIDGNFGLRGCVVNFRTTLEDARICIETIMELGAELQQES